MNGLVFVLVTAIQFTSRCHLAESINSDETAKDICECGLYNRLGRRIVGGDRADISKYPWMIGLSLNGFQSCGGSLLNRCFIITAGHCFKKIISPKQVEAVIGTDKRNPGKKFRVKISEIHRHPNYNPNQTHDDITILRLAAPINYSENVKPVCLPRKNQNYTGQQAVVIGLGVTSERGPTSDQLMEVTIPVISNGQCQKSFTDGEVVYDTNVCAGTIEGKDACQGDSGSSLVLQRDDRFEIIGVVSWGVGCGRKLIPGVYTRVAKYLHWIESITNQPGCCFQEINSGL